MNDRRQSVTLNLNSVERPNSARSSKKGDSSRAATSTVSPGRHGNNIARQTSPTDEFGEDDLVCCSCMRLYEDPVRLDCGHFACMKCVERLSIYTDMRRLATLDVAHMEGTVRRVECVWPLCRRITLLPEGRAADLHRQPAIAAAVQRCRDANSSEMCGSCEKRPAHVSCEQCQVSFCEACNSDIHSKGQMKRHILIQMHSSDAQLKCLLHQEKASAFCSDDEELVCRSCIVSGPHAQHHVVAIHDAWASLSEKVKQLPEQVEPIHADVQATKDLAAAGIQAAQKAFATAEEEIQRQFGNLMQLVMHRRDALLNLLRDLKAPQMEKANGQVAAMRVKEMACRELLSVSAEVTDETRATPLYTRAIRLFNDTTRVQCVYEPIEPTVAVFLGTDVLTDAIQKFGIIANATDAEAAVNSGAVLRLKNDAEKYALQKELEATRVRMEEERRHVSGKVVDLKARISETRAHNAHLSNLLTSPTSPPAPSARLFWISGVAVGISVKNLRGWKLVYQAKYCESTSLGHLDAICNRAQQVLVAARHVASPKLLETAAMGASHAVFKRTSPPNECHSHNGVFWYCCPGKCFGFSSTPDVELGYGDSSPGSKKLSWHLQGGGGCRVGNVKDLNSSTEWEKLIYIPQPD